MPFESVHDVMYGAQLDAQPPRPPMTSRFGLLVPLCPSASETPRGCWGCIHQGSERCVLLLSLPWQKHPDLSSPCDVPRMTASP